MGATNRHGRRARPRWPSLLRRLLRSRLLQRKPPQTEHSERNPNRHRNRKTQRIRQVLVVVAVQSWEERGRKGNKFVSKSIKAGTTSRQRASARASVPCAC